jgi:hypothetical protein
MGYNILGLQIVKCSCDLVNFKSLLFPPTETLYRMKECRPLPSETEARLTLLQTSVRNIKVAIALRECRDGLEGRYPFSLRGRRGYLVTVQNTLIISKKKKRFILFRSCYRPIWTSAKDCHAIKTWKIISTYSNPNILENI